MPKFMQQGESQGYIFKLTFDNKEQYELFMSYLKETTITQMRGEPPGQSLEAFYHQKFDPEQLEVTLKNSWGIESMVSKFMEVTRMIEMDYTQYMKNGYKPDENSPDIPLGRQGTATMNDSVLKRMKEYIPNQNQITGFRD